MIQTRLREIMLRREMDYENPYTINDIAQRSGLNRDTVANFRNNKTSRFDADTLDALCRTLGVQVGDLLVYIPDEDHTSTPEG